MGGPTATTTVLLAVVAAMAPGCSRGPTAPAPSRPVEGLACLTPTDPAAVAAALRDELLEQRDRHPALAGLSSPQMPTDAPRWDIAYGQREVPNRRYDAQLRDYEAETQRRQDVEARDGVRHWHPIHPPPRTVTETGPDGLRLSCTFETIDPRQHWSRSEAVVTTVPIDGGEVAELQAVFGPHFGDQIARVGETWVVFESSKPDLVTASVLTLAHRVAACAR